MAKSFDDLIKRVASKKVSARWQALASKYLNEMFLSELRKTRGLSQQVVADALGIKQPSLSKVENQSDMQISTLQRFLETLDAKLVLTAKLSSGETIQLKQFSPDSHAVHRKSRRTSSARPRKGLVKPASH